MDVQSEIPAKPAQASQKRCFACGEENSAGLHLEYHRNEDGTAVCQTIIADSFEGPTGYLHGGIISAMLDESMSKAMPTHGFSAMTRRMEIDFLHPVAPGQPLRLEGRVVSYEGRKCWTEAKILDAEGTVLAKGKGLFIELRAK